MINDAGDDEDAEFGDDDDDDDDDDDEFRRLCSGVKTSLVSLLLLVCPPVGTTLFESPNGHPPSKGTT